MAILQSIQDAAAQGIIWGVMALGLYITFKILNFADLTVDGSFATGGVVSAILTTKGIDPFLSLLISLAAGMICGFITGFLHTKLEIPEILAGILTMLALYSINLRILGQPNMALLGVRTTLTSVSEMFPSLSLKAVSAIIGIIAVVLVILFMYWFFGTEIGCSIRATGNNPYMVRALGVNTNTTKILALTLSNGLVALSGGMVAQTQGYADVGMGIGTIMIGLASIIIGEVLMGKRFSFAYKLTSAVFGSIVYRIIIALVLWFGLDTKDLKLLTSIMVAAALSVSVIKNKFTSKNAALNSNESGEADD